MNVIWPYIMEKFSVLMSVYHREKGDFLREALLSVFEQSMPPTEVVLVKDGPLTDELEKVIAEFVERYAQLKVVTLPQNVGLGRALNAGLAACSYELVARMDSDDLSLPKRFELQLQAFKDNPEVSIVGSWISEFESNPTHIIAYRKLPQTHDALLKFFRSKSPLNHVTVMFRKSEVIAVGGYEHFYLLEDYWLWARMLKNGAVFHNIPRVLVNVRGGAAMAARRGGWKYAKSEVRFQYQILSMALIGIGTFCKNIVVRFTVRMLPSRLRALIYRKLLR